MSTTLNNAIDNGFNVFKQQPVMGGAPAMPGMGAAPQMPGMKAPEPQVSYMLAVNNGQFHKVPVAKSISSA